nr:DNA-binding pseudobarrel domain-containing protein [Tanacetum cinerariifolium]
MVLSLLSQMPPTSTPPTIEESLAKLADNIDKLELVVKRLAASTTNLVSITSQTTTQLITETSSITTNINTPSTTMDKLFTSSASSFTKIEIEVTTPPVNTDTPTVIMPPSTNRQLVTTPPPNNHGPEIHPQKHDKPMAKSFTISHSSISKIENGVESETRVLLPPLIEDILAIFRCTRTFCTSHLYHPQKFVFVESEDDPPWRPHDKINVSRKDKAHFHAEGIDTSPVTTRIRPFPYESNKFNMPLPLKFVKKHLRNKILKDPILKSANGGYLWKLKMKKFDDHTFCFVDGWCNVVKDVGLLFGEFLLFKYVGSSVFLMHVYGVNGCEKILVPRINNFKVVDDEVSVFDNVEDEVEDDDNDVEYDVEEDEDEEDEEDDDVDLELGDDGEDGDDEDDVDVDGHDGDPYFIITSSKKEQK